MRFIATYYLVSTTVVIVVTTVDSGSRYTPVLKLRFCKLNSQLVQLRTPKQLEPPTTISLLKSSLHLK